MALYDHRVFRLDDNWWVGQVHSGTGGGSGTGPWRITEERVVFTNLSNEQAESRTTRIPAGFLNRMSHTSLVKRLRTADPLRSRFQMWPYNTPNEEDFHETEIITDEEGMRWGIKAVSTDYLSRHPIAADLMLDVTCLDDSALRRTFLWQVKNIDGEEARSAVVASMRGDLIRTVKSSFIDLE